MSRKEKKLSEKERRKQDDDLVQDTAAVFTCLTEIAEDFAYQCDDQSQNLEADIAFNKLALEMWRERKGPAEELVAILDALVDARERQRKILIELGKRFTALAAVDKKHQEHLGPPEAYRDLIRRRILS